MTTLFGKTPKERTPAQTGLVTVLAILLGILLVLEVFSLVLKQTVLNPSFHTQIIEDQHIVDKVTASLPGMLVKLVLPSGALGDSLSIPADQLGKFLNQAIPEQWVVDQIDGWVPQLIGFVESDQGSLDIRVDFSTIKQNLIAQTTDITQSIMASMPECTTGQMLAYLKSALQGKASDVPFCLPSAPFTKLIQPVITSTVTKFISGLPDHFGLGTISLDNNPALVPLVRGLKWVRLLAQVHQFAPYLIIGLLFILLLTNLKSLRFALHGIGLALFGAGIGLLVIVFAITLYERSLDLQSAFGSAVPLLDPAILTGYFEAIFKGVESMTLKLSAPLGLGGLLIVIITRIRKKLI